MKFRNKPLTIEIDAMKWTGRNFEALKKFVGNTSLNLSDSGLKMHVLKGNSYCYLDVGDYIIAESDGRGFYPCVENVFKAKYEKIT